MHFPRYLDAPTRILFWTLDQIVPFSTMALVGMLTKKLLICLVLGGLISWGLTKFKDSKPDGYLMHMLYWYGLLPLKGRSFLNPFFRRIYPA